MRTGLTLLVLVALTGCVADEGWRGLIPDQIGVGAARTQYDYLGVDWQPAGDRLHNEDGDANTIHAWMSWDLKSGSRHNALLERVDSLQAALLAQANRPAPTPAEVPPREIRMQWPETPPGWAKPVPAPASDPGSLAAPAWLGAAVDRVVAALDRFTAALGTIPKQIELKAPPGQQGPQAPIVIEPADVVVKIEPGTLQPQRTAPNTTVVVENQQTSQQEQRGQMGQAQQQEQEQEQEQEQKGIEERVIGGLKGAGEVVGAWSFWTWAGVVGLILTLGAVFFFGLRAWRRRNAPVEPEEDEDQQDGGDAT